MRCVGCLELEEDARLDGAPLCLGCVDRVLAGARLEPRLCSRCHAVVRGGRQDSTPVCVDCARAELERAAAVEQAPGLAEWLPPLDERWRPRRLEPVKLDENQVREQLAELRRVFAATGRIVPPAPPRRHWLDD